MFGILCAVRVEADLMSIDVENRDIGRRHDRIEQVISF